MWCESMTQNEGYWPLKTEINDYGYIINSRASGVDLSSTIGYNDTLYFPYKIKQENCYNYWISSPSAYGDYMLNISCEGKINVNYCDNKYTAFRPLVHLKSKVRATKDENTSIWKLE